MKDDGGVSQHALELFADSGFTWVASGGSVLDNSHDAHDKACSHRVYQFGGAPVNCVFRDDGLSDLIGFTYSDWHAEDAVGNLIGHMENIAQLCPDRDDCLISIILDGENAWEYYPKNGHYFLNHLYEALAEHPGLELTTFTDFLAQHPTSPSPEERLVAGSWVYGTFSTWIGDPEKNRAWELLVEAKQAFDRQVAAGNLTPEEFAATFAAIEAGAWDLAPMITHRFALEDFEEAFALMDSGECGKIVMFPNPADADGPLTNHP